MNFNWGSLSIGFVGGILASFIANWLFHKFVTLRRSKADHFSMSYASGGMRVDVEGYDPANINIHKIMEDMSGIEK